MAAITASDSSTANCTRVASTPDGEKRPGPTTRHRAMLRTIASAIASNTGGTGKKCPKTRSICQTQFDVSYRNDVAAAFAANAKVAQCRGFIMLAPWFHMARQQTHARPQQDRSWHGSASSVAALFDRVPRDALLRCDAIRRAQKAGLTELARAVLSNPRWPLFFYRVAISPYRWFNLRVRQAEASDRCHKASKIVASSSLPGHGATALALTVAGNPRRIAGQRLM